MDTLAFATLSNIVPSLAASSSSLSSLSSLSCLSTTVPTHLRLPNVRQNTPRMLQSPENDGPPSLGALDAARATTAGMQGAAITFGTSRVSLEIGDDDQTNEIDEGALSSIVKSSIVDAVSKASGDTRIVHLSYTPDLPWTVIAPVVQELNNANNYTIIGRAVAKKGGTPRTLEALALASGTGISIGIGKSNDSAQAAAEKAVKQAIVDSDEKGNPKDTIIFAIFTTSARVQESDVRAAVGKTVPAYGGRSAGGAMLALGETYGTGDAQEEEGKDYVVSIGLLHGSTSFLVSAVVKNWMQPAYVEALEYLKPKYTGKKEQDLLESIKFDDWNTFISCLESVDVNYQWVNRQHQTPLLASAGRGRTRMVEELIKRGADVRYRNDGGFNAVMYTIRLNDYGEDFVKKQLKVLEDGGADLNDIEIIIPPRRA